MSVATREPQAPESYATFWEPIDIGVPTGAPAPPTAATPDEAEAKDAYLEFVNVAEGVPAPPRVKPA
jgi:hypothetical protein